MFGEKFEIAISLIIVFLSVMFSFFSGMVPIVMRYNKRITVTGKVLDVSVEQQLRFSKMYHSSAFTVACLIFIGSLLNVASIVLGLNDNSIIMAYSGFMFVPVLLNATRAYDKEIKNFQEQIRKVT